jgi:DNA-binding NtrC family response regulator
MIAVERQLEAVRSLARDHRVLCVDDEADVLRALRRALRNQPFDLMTTTEPEQALAWVEDHDVSLVLSDQRMPTMAGTTLIERIRENSPTTICAVLTAYPGSVLVGGRPAFGIRELVLKPWNDEELRGTIVRLLRERETGRGRTISDEDETFDLGGEEG